MGREEIACSTSSSAGGYDTLICVTVASRVTRVSYSNGTVFSTFVSQHSFLQPKRTDQWNSHQLSNRAKRHIRISGESNSNTPPYARTHNQHAFLTRQSSKYPYKQVRVAILSSPTHHNPSRWPPLHYRDQPFGYSPGRDLL